MKIYTKTGDKGETGLVGGSRVAKDSAYIEAYGDVDELNSLMGFCITACAEADIKNELQTIQHELHILSADLATPFEAESKLERISSSRTSRLEVLIDQFEKELEPLRQFVLAGGVELAARLHMARVVCRRSERRVISLSKSEKTNPEVITYLNRLSDLIFVLARLANKRAGSQDIPWDQSV
jgi:cob(I)alamin adenosyltransferase